MAKYHISKNGKPSICRATKKCPLGGESGSENHFSSKSEAQAFIDKKNEGDFGVIPGIKENVTQNKSELLKTEFAPEIEPIVETMKRPEFSEIAHDHGIQFADSDFKDLIENPNAYHRNFQNELMYDYAENGNDRDFKYTKEEKLAVAAQMENAIEKTRSRLSSLNQQSGFVDPERSAPVYSSSTREGGFKDYSKSEVGKTNEEKLAEVKFIRNRKIVEKLDPVMRSHYEGLSPEAQRQIVSSLTSNKDRDVTTLEFSSKEIKDKDGNYKHSEIYATIQDNKTGEVKKHYEGNASTRDKADKVVAQASEFFDSYNY